MVWALPTPKVHSRTSALWMEGVWRMETSRTPGYPQDLILCTIVLELPLGPENKGVGGRKEMERNKNVI